METIFLTAHADFLYAKEAVALGSFDYILQPARYEEIEDAVGRATEKIRMKQRVNEDSRYGQLLKNKKGVVLGAMLADLFSEEKNDKEIAMHNLRRNRNLCDGKFQTEPAGCGSLGKGTGELGSDAVI